MTRRPTAELLERRNLLAIDVTVAQADLTADPNLLVNSLAGTGDGAGLTYVADRAHYQYAGKLPDATIAGIIQHATGVMGSNRDYLRNTVQHLEEMGIADTSLHRILKLVERDA